MDRSALARQLMTTFVEELEEHVRTFNREVLALEREPATAARGERLATLLRTAHSLKGAARAVNVRAIESAAHQLEETFLALRDARLQFGAEVYSLLFAALDALEDAGGRLRSQEDLSVGPLAELLPRLEAVAAGGHVSPLAPAPPAGPAEVPPDRAAGPGFVRVQSFFVALPPVIVAAAIDVVRDVGPSDWLAEKVTGFYLKLHLLADRDELLWRCDRHLVLGFLVLFNLEATAHGVLGAAGFNVVAAQ